MRRTLGIVLSLVTMLWAYPPAYQTSLEQSPDTGISFWFMIPEDIQGTFSLGGSGEVVYKNGDTAVISIYNSYADTLHYRFIKQPGQTSSDFDALVVDGSRIRVSAFVDSVENMGVDLAAYGDRDGLWLDSLMSAPEYADFDQRLYGIGMVGGLHDSIDVVIELAKYVSIYDADNPPPTIRNVRYGPSCGRQVFDFWSAETDEPAPVYMFIHGGGWGALEKSMIRDDATWWRSRGFATVSINYRVVSVSKNDGLDPPSMGPLYDAARAMQALRSKAAEFNIDPDRIATGGGSAGGCSSMWLALHDDIADPSSSDPVARYSSKPTVATGLNAQTSLNPYDFIEWPYIGTTNAIFSSGMPPGAYGISSRNKTWQQVKDELLAVPRDILDEYSPLTHVSSDDVPVYLEYIDGLVNCTPDSCVGGAIHHAQMGVALKEKMDAVGVECVLDIPEESFDDPYGSVKAFILDKLSTPTSMEKVILPGIIQRNRTITLRKIHDKYLLSSLNKGTLQVFNASGKKIPLSSSSQGYLLPASAKGIYFYVFKTKGNTEYGTLVISK